MDQKKLKNVLLYNKETGEFFLKERKDKLKQLNTRFSGKKAGSKDKRGYILIKIDGKSYKAHRLAWLHEYGNWPEDQIDHINGNPSDNRIENLRDVINLVNQNNLNSKRYKIKTTNHLITQRKKSKKYRVQTGINNKCFHFSYFSTAAEAHLAYLNLQKIKTILDVFRETREN
jgi:hypothetical protein